MRRGRTHGAFRAWLRFGSRTVPCFLPDPGAPRGFRLVLVNARPALADRIPAVINGAYLRRGGRLHCSRMILRAFGCETCARASAPVRRAAAVRRVVLPDARRHIHVAHDGPVVIIVIDADDAGMVARPVERAEKEATCNRNAGTPRKVIARTRCVVAPPRRPVDGRRRPPPAAINDHRVIVRDVSLNPRQYVTGRYRRYVWGLRPRLCREYLRDNALTLTVII